MSKGNLENSIEDNSVIINGRENIVIQNSTGEITINKNYIENRKSALLGLVDISIKKDLLISQNPFPILDIKVRNNSDEAIFINKIEIECIKSWQLAWKKDYYLMPVSHRYDFIITEEDSCIIEDLSQFVRPNYVDRFEVRLASERGIPLGEEGISPHLIRFTLVYNEDMKRVTSRKMLLDIPSKNQMEGGHFMGKTRKEELHLMEVANEVLHSIDENTIFDKKYVDVIKSWAS